MPSSYYDLLAPQDVQQAAAAPFAQQSAQNLAVLPAVQLRPALQAAARRQVQGQQLALGERRLALAEDAQDFAQGQLPWEIAGGVAAGGLRLYGGYRALQQQEQQQALATQTLQGQRDILATTQRQNVSLLDASRRIAELYQRHLQPAQ
jgi:hypothetical protein